MKNEERLARPLKKTEWFDWVKKKEDRCDSSLKLKTVLVAENLNTLENTKDKGLMEQLNLGRDHFNLFI